MRDTLESAVGLAAAGRHDEALEAFNALIGEPPNAAVLGHRAWLYRSVGRFEEAVQDYERLLSVEPGDDTARALLAETLCLKGDYAPAIAAAVDVLRRSPFHALAGAVVLRAQRAMGHHASPDPAAHHPVAGAAGNPVIAALDEAGIGRAASTAREVSEFIFTLIKMTGARQVLEVGCYIGYTSLWIAQALKELGGGQLHIVDLFKEEPEEISPVIGHRAGNYEMVTGHLKAAGLEEYVTLHKGASGDVLRKLQAGGALQFDLAFIDADHRIMGAKTDFVLVNAMMRVGGLMLLHDTNPESCGWVGPRLILEHLQAQGGGAGEWMNLKTGDGYGLGLIAANPVYQDWRPSITDRVCERLFMSDLNKKRRAG